MHPSVSTTHLTSYKITVSCSVTRTVREPELFSTELSRTFGASSVQNVGRTPAQHIQEAYIVILTISLFAQVYVKDGGSGLYIKIL